MGEKTYSFDSVFLKELTVNVNVSNNKVITAEEVIDEIERRCGTGTVLACVPKYGTSYEVVMKERKYIGDLISSTIHIKGKVCKTEELVSSYKIVSILNLSMYVSDEEIIDRFEKMGVEIVSDIKKRKMGSRAGVCDGTRVFKAKLPPTLPSIPYSMKFSVNDKETAYYRVLHNHQVKVCSGCFSSDHIYKDCPDFVCYTCKKQGHISRHCSENRCLDCGNFKTACICRKRKRYWGDGFGPNPARSSGFGSGTKIDHDGVDHEDHENMEENNSVSDARNQSSEEGSMSKGNNEMEENNNAKEATVNSSDEVENQAEKNGDEDNSETRKSDGKHSEVSCDEVNVDGVENYGGNGEMMCNDEQDSIENVSNELSKSIENVNVENVISFKVNIENETVELKTPPVSEQECSQGGGEESEEAGNCGELDDIELDDSPWTEVSQGENINNFSQKSILKFKKSVRRDKLKIVPNYKAATLAHMNKKLKKKGK